MIKESRYFTSFFLPDNINVMAGKEMEHSLFR